MIRWTRAENIPFPRLFRRGLELVTSYLRKRTCTRLPVTVFPRPVLLKRLHLKVSSTPILKRKPVGITKLALRGTGFRKLYTELNLYSIQVRNLLVARRVDNDQYVGVNAGKADHNGVEFTSVYQENIDENWQIQLRLTGNLTDYHFDRFVDLGENYSGNELPGVPEYSLIPSAEVEFKNFGFYLNYQAFGRIALNDANAAYTEAYQLLNSQLRYSNNLGKLDYSFKVGANNLFDEAYAASVVTNAVGFGGASPRFYYPGNPRNYYGSISVKYRF